MLGSKFQFHQILKVHSVSNSESTVSDQTPRSVASGMVLHSLPMSQKKDARLKWI